MKSRTKSSLAFLLVAALAFTACGGGDSADEAADVAASPTEETALDVSSTDDADVEDSVDEAPETGATFEPGEIGFRAVNLLDEPVDIYVRTQGFVEVFPIQEGLAPGEITEFIVPPVDGVFLVTTAGSGDADCVGTCDHFVTLITAFADDGPNHTVVLYNDEFSGPSAFDLWEQPVGERNNSNAMAPARSDAALAVFTAIALTDAEFGLRLAIPGTDGCLEPDNGANVLVGGNQTPTYDLSGVASFALHDNQDRECVEAPVGGPFPFEANNGERTHVLLNGSPGNMTAATLVMSGSVAGTEEPSASDSPDYDRVVDLMASEMADNFPLTDDEATCAAGLLVAAVGVDVVYDGTQLVDLDALGPEAEALAGEAIFDSVDTCGIDPSVYGG